METVTIYEYLIEGSEIVKLTYTAEKLKNGGYRFKAGKRKTFRYLYDSDFDIVKNKRVVSFEDNLDKFKHMIIENLKESIKRKEKLLEADKNKLKMLS